MKEHRKIKGLKYQIKKMEGDAEALKTEISIKQRELSQKQNTIKSLKQQVQKIDNNKNIKVSEHAIIRYLERIKGVDIEEIEKEILSDEVLNLVEKLGGNGGYPNKNFKVLMSNDSSMIAL